MILILVSANLAKTTTSLVRVKFHCFASMADHLVFISTNNDASLRDARKKSGKGEIDFSCFLGKVDFVFSTFPVFQEISSYFSQKTGKVEK